MQIDKLRDILPLHTEVIFSDDKNVLLTVDVVIFDLPFMPSYFRKDNITKQEGQIWVAWCLECEQNYPWIMSPELRLEL